MMLAAKIAVSVVVVAVSAAVYRWAQRRRREAETGPSSSEGAVAPVSVPEAIHALSHCSRPKRDLAARALGSMLFGEAQVLEEALDEHARKHSDFGAARRDGRRLFEVLIHDARRGSQPPLEPAAWKESWSNGSSPRQHKAALALLLACTEHDANWSDDDEWNEYAAKARALIRGIEGAVDLTTAAPETDEAAAVLRARLASDSRTPAPESFMAVAERETTPDVVSFNTRVQCAHCAQMTQAHHCSRCRNVCYCSEDHAALDAARHRFWCFNDAPLLEE